MKNLVALFWTFLLTGIFVTQTQAQLTVSTTVLANVTCHGLNNGSASATPSGGTTPYTYLWAPGSQTTSTITGLAAGTYTINVTDHVGLTASASATITQPAAITTSARAQSSAICPGSADSLYATVHGGTTPYSYTWTAPFGDVSCPTCQNTNSYPYGSAYMVTAVNDANGCSATASVSVTVRPFPYVTVSGPLNPIAPGRSDTLVANVVGTATYLWSNSATTSSIIVSPSVSTTYFVTTTNTYGCYDTTHYTIDTNRTGNGLNSNPIHIIPSSYVNPISFSSKDSEVWFSFVPTDSNNQIIAYSAFLGMPVPHVHRLTLFNSSFHTIVDEPMPDITGANQIRIDISHLKIDSTYYVRAARTPAHTNMPGCNPTGDECNASQRWDFQIAFRTVPVFVPKDSGSEPPAANQLYYEDRGQISDLNDIPRFDIKAYTNYASPAVYASDSALSFVYKDTASIQRVDMVLAGPTIQPSQPVFKMEEDSTAGFLTYFKEYTFNAVPKLEGYSRLVYKNVYPSVDMQVYSNSKGTKFYFVCNPSVSGIGAGNPANIELKFKGANSVTVNSDSGISVSTDFGTLSFAPGYAYMDSAGIIVSKSWHANFEAVNSNTVKFHTGTYNINEPLIIEVDRGEANVSTSYPAIDNLDWSTYYGGINGGDYSINTGVCHDDSGNVYTVGYTTSTRFPVQIGRFSHLQDTLGGDTDATVVRFNSAYKRIWACYYGGSGAEIAHGIGVYNNSITSSDIIYITGRTNSTNLPFIGMGHSFQYKLNGTGSGPNSDIFIAAIYASGFDVTQSFYYGGIGNESAHSLAVWESATPCLYVVGVGDTNTKLEHKSNAYNSTTGTGLILRFNLLVNIGDIDTASWVTLIGSKKAGLNSCAVDPSGYLYVAGADSGSSYPVKGYYASTFSGGDDDAVITKFKPNDTILWSTYYGGDGRDVANAITADASGNAYVTGHTFSPDPYLSILEEREGPYSYFQPYNGNPPPGNNGNAFLAMFQGNAFLYDGTYFGGAGDVDGAAICLDANNNVYITGSSVANTNGMVWPTHNPSNTYVRTNVPLGATETFLAVFNSYSQYYYWGTYVCALTTGTCTGLGITAFGNQQLYIVGNTVSFPYEFVDPSPGYSWFQGQNIDSSNTAMIGFISEFYLPIVPTAVNVLKVENGELKVYPNPTSQNVTVQMILTNQQEVEFKLYNLFGELVYSENMNEPGGIITKEISLSSLPNGNYIIQAITPDKVYYKKIIKLQ